MIHNKLVILNAIGYGVIPEMKSFRIPNGDDDDEKKNQTHSHCVLWKQVKIQSIHLLMYTNSTRNIHFYAYMQQSVHQTKRMRKKHTHNDFNTFSLEI